MKRAAVICAIAVILGALMPAAFAENVKLPGGGTVGAGADSDQSSWTDESGQEYESTTAEGGAHVSRVGELECQTQMVTSGDPSSPQEGFSGEIYATRCIGEVSVPVESGDA